MISVVEALLLVEAARDRGLDPGPRLWARVLSRAFADRLREVTTAEDGPAPWARLATPEYAGQVLDGWLSGRDSSRRRPAGPAGRAAPPTCPSSTATA